MGGGGGGGDEDKGNGRGTGGVLQVNHAVGVIIWDQELSVDGVHTKINIGITSSGSQMDCGDDGAAYDERRVGVALGG